LHWSLQAGPCGRAWSPGAEKTAADPGVPSCFNANILEAGTQSYKRRTSKTTNGRRDPDQPESPDRPVVGQIALSQTHTMRFGTST